MKKWIKVLLLYVVMIPLHSFSQCGFTFIDVNISACDPTDNSFEITGSVEVQNPPATGQLIVEDCNGNQETFNAPFNSPTNYTLTGIDSDGTTGCDLTAYFTDETACTISSSLFDYPQSCLCNADVGTFSDSINGISTSTGPYLLCFGDELDIIGNGDFVPSEDFNLPNTTYDPGVFLLVYDCPPTVFNPNDINTDTCLVGIASSNDQAWTIVNNVGDNSTLWFVPVTMYSMVDVVYAVSINGGDWCFDMGPTYEVTFLEDNSINNVEVNSTACSEGEYSTSGQIDFVNPPATGQLIVTDCNGNQQSFNAPFTSPTMYNITGQSCDGASCSIMAYFTTDSSGCNIDISYTAPPSYSCFADIGTYSSSSGTDSTHLCYGDSLQITSNGDNVDPTDVGLLSGSSYDPGIGFMLFSCPPTLGIDPETDPCYEGVWSMDSIGESTFLNQTGVTPIDAFPPGTFPNNVVYVAAITLYNYQDTIYDSLCFDLSDVAVVVFHDEYASSINPIVNDTLCTNDGPISITATDTTGAWSSNCGACLDSNGVFNAGMANIGTNTIYYSVGDSVCTVQDSLTIFVEECAGITEYEKEEVSVYPNPASTSVTISAETLIDAIKIVDLHGRVNDNITMIKAPKSKVDLSDYAKGIYLVEITTKTGVLVKKLMVE